LQNLQIADADAVDRKLTGAPQEGQIDENIEMLI
jgi:hypothetical protein